MSFQVTLNSRNVLVPLSLESREGERMNNALSRLDTATAMVIQVSSIGGFTQEFVPLKISQDASRAYAGEEWELWVQKAAGEIFSYYLGVPDRFHRVSIVGIPPRSRMVQRGDLT